MGKPRCWVISMGGGLASRSMIEGPLLNADEDVPVREDQATEADIQAVAASGFGSTVIATRVGVIRSLSTTAMGSSRLIASPSETLLSTPGTTS